MGRLASWIVALALVAAACSDSGDTTTTDPPEAPAATTTAAPPTTAATTTTLPRTTTTAAATTTAAPTTTVPPPTTASTEDVLAEMERRILAAGIVGGGVPVTRDEAGCLAQVIAATLGAESIDIDAAQALLTGAGTDPLLLAIGDQADAILAGGAECVDIFAKLAAEVPEGVDPEEFVLQSIAEGVLEGAASDPILDIDEEGARCVGQGMFDTLGPEGIEVLALADMLGLADPDSPLPGATDEQLAGFVQTMLDCVDFTTLLSATFQEDGLSAESADCAAEAMLETSFFEELVAQIAVGEEAFPDDPEIVGELVQVLLACLTPEEIGELINEG